MRRNTLPFQSLLLTFFTAFLLTSCMEDEIVRESLHYTDDEYRVLAAVLDLPRERDNYAVSLAPHMTRNGVRIPFINNAKATLGRVLFYDTKLSRNNSVSCASCHHQSLAFSDNVARSKGFNGELTFRNSLALGATANFSSSYDNGGGNVDPFGGNIGFFWDERVFTIADQSMQTIQDDIEMGMDLGELSRKLSKEEYYRILFNKAYGDDKVAPERITEALQEFINAFVSANSHFDEQMNRHFNPEEKFSGFSERQNRGKALFMANCATCHGHDMTRPAARIANNGLDQQYEDNGVGRLTGAGNMDGLFKVPFLRNIELTGPYMHDGRFQTLEEVVEHYSAGIKGHPNLDARLKDQQGEPLRMNFSTEDKAALVDFLKTLTDRQFVNDDRLSDPFF